MEYQTKAWEDVGMQRDFHYYATYAAAYLAGYSHEECMDICYSAEFVDHCSVTLLTKIGAPNDAATTQLQLELMDSQPDFLGIMEMTRIWASFHFLPYDLYAKKKWALKPYMNKYRLICKPNGALLTETVNLAKDKSLQAVGIAMHVLADTWAHSYFAGTPSQVINNTNYDFYELVPDGDGFTERQIKFRHKTSTPDDIEAGLYTNTIHQGRESSIMNLGHGRAGHLPDYSFARYRYAPAWGDYNMITKDNPSDYMKAFKQMVYAMKYLRGEYETFELDKYDTDTVAPYEDWIRRILEKRQLDACDDWKAFGERLSDKKIEPFDLDKYQDEYLLAPATQKNYAFIGKFIEAAYSQKHMVTDRIYKSGNHLAGISRNK